MLIKTLNKIHRCFFLIDSNLFWEDQYTGTTKYLPHLKVFWVVTAETIITFGFKRYNTSLPHSLTNIVKKNPVRLRRKRAAGDQASLHHCQFNKTLNLLTLTQLQPSHPKHSVVCFILLFCHYLHGGLSPTNLVRMQTQWQLSPWRGVHWKCHTTAKTPPTPPCRSISCISMAVCCCSPGQLRQRVQDVRYHFFTRCPR